MGTFLIILSVMAFIAAVICLIVGLVEEEAGILLSTFFWTALFFAFYCFSCICGFFGCRRLLRCRSSQ
jgi:hypothetical protein